MTKSASSIEVEKKQPVQLTGLLQARPYPAGKLVGLTRLHTTVHRTRRTQRSVTPCWHFVGRAGMLCFVCVRLSIGQGICLQARDTCHTVYRWDVFLKLNVLEMLLVITYQGISVSTAARVLNFMAFEGGGRGGGSGSSTLSVPYVCILF